MAINPMRGSKWEPYYEGPFHVEKQHEGGAYSLFDTMGEIMDHRFTINMLKPVGGITIEKEQNYEVERVLTIDNLAPATII